MKSKKHLAIISTHPIQYNAPLFKLLSNQPYFTIKVFYTRGQTESEVFDKDFGQSVEWDIPLLEEYDFTFVKNISSPPETARFNGIINPTLNKEILDWRPDALLVFGWSYSSHLKAIRYFYNKIPVFFRGDSTLIDETLTFSFKKIIRRLFLTWVYRHINFALYVGSANKAYFLAHGLKFHQLLFAPHAVDNHRFADPAGIDSNKAKAWKNSLGIKENERVFLFAGKLTKKKNPELLIKSFLALPQNWKLVIAGSGELENELKQKYESCSSIIFIGFQNQSKMPVVYRLGDVFILPSQGPGETWGLAINEAMACGKAVIVSDKCGCSADLVVNDKNGYVFEHDKQESLEKCMRLVMKNYKEQGIYSQQLISNWSYAATVDQIDRTLRQFFGE